MFLQGQKVGKYEIIRSLGSGGFGSVYLARDTWLDIKVAIKVPHKQSQELYKLLKEPRLQAALNHPNIVRMIAAEKEYRVFFMVMEYIKGKTMEKVLEKEGTLDWTRAVDLLKQIAHGDPELITVWKDPDFDPNQRAFYYDRVIEIPTPRWTAYDAKRLGSKPLPGTSMMLQERAYTSPIWYQP